MPARPAPRHPPPHPEKVILLHTGAGQPARVWPLGRYHQVVQKLRNHGYAVKVVCDPAQRVWWLDHGETQVLTPVSLETLIALLQESSAFIGNDSGPGHLAALLGIPTFTFFGSGLSELFSPLHRDAEWIDGKPCPYRGRCFDMCRYPLTYCMSEISEDEAWSRLGPFVQRHCLPADRPTIALKGQQSVQQAP